MTALIEATLSWLLRDFRGRDAKSFYTAPAFADHRTPTVDVAAPDCGPSGGVLARDYSVDGAGRMPTLEWKLRTAAAKDGGSAAKPVAEWLLVSEDPDAPLAEPICHGIYLGIPATKTRVENSDFELQDEKQSLLKGGFHYGQNRKGNVYIPPRPLLNHGPHRYFFEVIALSEPLDKELVKSRPSRQQVADAIKGKVLGWGSWVGSYERKW